MHELVTVAYHSWHRGAPRFHVRGGSSQNMEIALREHLLRARPRRRRGDDSIYSSQRSDYSHDGRPPDDGRMPAGAGLAVDPWQAPSSQTSTGLPSSASAWLGPDGSAQNSDVFMSAPARTVAVIAAVDPPASPPTAGASEPIIVFDDRPDVFPRPLSMPSSSDQGPPPPACNLDPEGSGAWDWCLQRKAPAHRSDRDADDQWASRWEWSEGRDASGGWDPSESWAETWGQGRSSGSQQSRSIAATSRASGDRSRSRGWQKQE